MLAEAVSETLSGPQLSYYIPLSWAPGPQPQLNKQGHEKAQHWAPWGGHHHTCRSATDEATKSSGESAGCTRLHGQVPAPNASSQPHPESTYSRFPYEHQKWTLSNKWKQKVYFQEVLVPKVGAGGGKKNIFLIRFLPVGPLTMGSIQTCLNLQARTLCWILFRIKTQSQRIKANVNSRKRKYKPTRRACSSSTRAASLGLFKPQEGHSLFALLAAGRCFLALGPDGWFCFHEGI